MGLNQAMQDPLVFVSSGDRVRVLRRSGARTIRLDGVARGPPLAVVGRMAGQMRHVSPGFAGRAPAGGMTRERIPRVLAGPRVLNLMSGRGRRLSLARDLEVLVHGHGFTLAAAGVVDMFPHTAHIESLALLTDGS